MWSLKGEYSPVNSPGFWHATDAQFGDTVTLKQLRARTAADAKRHSGRQRPPRPFR